MQRRHLLLTGAALALSLAGPARADDYIGGYRAFIGNEDLHNSKGARLTAPWQVLRQDRANYHRFGIRQPGDEGDPFFADANNRAAMEQMILHGRIERSAGDAIMRGGVMVEVSVYGRGGVGTSIQVRIIG